MDLKNKMVTQVKKIPELDTMKFYGILFVVLGHVAMMYTPMSVIPHFANMSSFMAVVKNVIYAFHMPMFIFIIYLLVDVYLRFNWKYYVVKLRIKVF